VLGGADVLVLAHPSDPRWEAVVPGGSPVLSDAELDAIEAWVHAGGGLVVLGETEEDKYGANLNALVGRFGVSVTNATVSDYEAHHGGAPHWVLADLAPAATGWTCSRASMPPASTGPPRSSSSPAGRGRWPGRAARPRRPARRSSRWPSTAPAASSWPPTPTSSGTTAWATCRTRRCG
jgi:hypothetical protein